MKPKESSSHEAVFIIILGGTIGFIGALIVLLLEMGDRIHESFLLYWFVLRSPLYASTIMISFTAIGCLVAYRFAHEAEEIATLKGINQGTNEFISMITHEMRAPLSSALFGIDMFLKGSFGKIAPEQKEYLQKVYDRLNNLGILTQDLFDITKLELGRLGFSLHYISLQEIDKNIQETIQRFVPIAGERNVAITSSFPLHRSGRFLHIDWGKINQVIENLVENSINYTPVGGKISVHVKDDQHSFLLMVSDNGIGIAQKEQVRIFSKFFRAANARKIHSSGTGIGLYLCQQIVNAHSGKIWFVSEENKGTTFYVSLPVVTSSMLALQEVEEFLVRI